MKRIKIIKIYNNERYDYENTEITHTIADGIDWHEVDDKRLAELRKLIDFANQNRYQLNADYTLQIVEEITPATVEVHLELAKKMYEEHLEKLRKRQEKEEKTRIAREEKRKANELVKKQKLLDQLQKELGDQK